MPIKAVALVAEDELSLSVLQRLVIECNPALCVSHEFMMRGFGNIRKNSEKYIRASNVLPHIVLTDLDRYPCANALFQDWGITEKPETCVFRVAVKEVESWLLADRAGFARFLNIQINQIPAYPEQEQDPKQTLINLARRSRQKGLSRDLVPSVGSSAPIGPFYNSRLSQFASLDWNIQEAAINSDSLNRAINRITSL